MVGLLTVCDGATGLEVAQSDLIGTRNQRKDELLNAAAQAQANRGGAAPKQRVPGCTKQKQPAECEVGDCMLTEEERPWRCRKAVADRLAQSEVLHQLCFFLLPFYRYRSRQPHERAAHGFDARMGLRGCPQDADAWRPRQSCGLQPPAALSGPELGERDGGREHGAWPF